VGANRRQAAGWQPPAHPAANAPEVVAADPTLRRDQHEYVEDVVAFAKTTEPQVRERMKRGSVPLKEEWTAGSSRAR
jgi:hypothetical protein